jgi:hypothetical protein
MPINMSSHWDHNFTENSNAYKHVESMGSLNGITTSQKIQHLIVFAVPSTSGEGSREERISVTYPVSNGSIYCSIEATETPPLSFPFFSGNSTAIRENYLNTPCGTGFLEN